MRTEEHRTLAAAATRVTRLVRPADQVDLEFHLVNLRVDPDTNRLEPVDAAEPTFVRIVVGSQHTVEDARVAGDAAPHAPVAHRSAAASKLVVDVSGGEYTVAALLLMVREALLLDGRADPRSKPTPGPPSDDVTALEVPEGLVVSPIPPFRFTAATAPRTVTSPRCGRPVSEARRSRRCCGPSTTATPTTTSPTEPWTPRSATS